jgi:hypothetical protein
MALLQTAPLLHSWAEVVQQQSLPAAAAALATAPLHHQAALQTVQ